MTSPYNTLPQSPFPTMQPFATAPAPGAFPMPQPGMPQPGIPMVPQGGWLPPNTTCPPGLEYLMVLDHLFVEQKIELIEEITGLENKNKYVVMNIRGETVYYVVEDSGICARLCMGSHRCCEFHVYDGNRREILRMVRPCRSESCCCPCCLQKLEIYSGDTLLGTVSQNWTLWRPSFSIEDASGETVLIIKGPWFQFCVDAMFKVKSADGVHRIGEIKKEWSGMGRELFTKSDNFGINFPMDLDVKIKAVLFGACLLIDFMYFEK